MPLLGFKLAEWGYNKKSVLRDIAKKDHSSVKYTLILTSPWHVVHCGIHSFSRMYTECNSVVDNGRLSYLQPSL